MLELQRCGYTPIQTFEIGEEDVATTEISRSLRAKINSAIEVAQAKSVAEIFLLIGWEHSWAIESISNMLRLVPIPVYLLPDDNITRYLGRRYGECGYDVGCRNTTFPANEDRAVR